MAENSPLDAEALFAAVRELDRAADFAAAEAGLHNTARAIGMPVLAVSPNVSWPSFDAHVDAFLRRGGWPDEILSIWWDKNVMLKIPLYIQCRTRQMPFVTGDLARTPAGRPELQKIAQAMTRMNVRSLITLPVHLPRGQIGMVTWGGPQSVKAANEILSAHRPELIAAGHLFMHAFRSLTGILRSSEEEQSRLTPREWECLRLTAQGCREEEVATIVGLASTTVRYHLDNVVRKLGASNRANAVALAAQLGVLGSIG